MSTKKKICIILLALLLIVLIGFLILKNTVFNKWIKNSEYLYDLAVQTIINEEKEHSPDRNVSGFHTFANFHKFEIKKKSN